jgi:ribosomal-protein-serine acetyltransferase
MTGQGNERPNELIEHAPVTLRRFRADDVDALFQAVTESLDHLRPWMPWAADYSRASAEEYLAGSVKGWDEGTEYNYAIMTAGTLAGGISLMTRAGPGGLEIGYWVHRAYAGRGLATAATAALVGLAFGLPGVDWVEIVHEELNVASGQIPRKLGFTEVGRRPLDPPPTSSVHGGLPSPVPPGPSPFTAGTGIGVVWRLTR